MIALRLLVRMGGFIEPHKGRYRVSAPRPDGLWVYVDAAQNDETGIEAAIFEAFDRWAVAQEAGE